MDKNMIKIDDLLRERLGDAEEQERPGAWLHMRDLLDKQMPVRGVPGGAYNWRRMFGYLGGLMLLLAISAGGYQAMHSFSSDGDIAANNNGPAFEQPTTGLAGTAANTALPAALRETQDAAQAPMADVADNSVTAKNTAITVSSIKADAATGSKPSKLTAGAPSTIARAEKTTGSKDAGTQKIPAVDNNGFTASSGKTVSSGVLSDAAGNKAPDSKPATIAAKSNSQTAVAPAVQTAIDNNTPAQPVLTASSGQPKTTAPGTDNTAGAGKNPGQQGKSQMPAAGNTKPADNKPADKDYDVKEVTVGKIEIHERETKRGVVKKDTIFNGEDVIKVKVPKEGEMLALNKTDEEASGSNINPSAAAPSANKEVSEDDAPMQKLGDHNKTASKKMKNYNPHRFEEMVRNARFRFGSMKFYPGLVIGANAAINGNLGLQAGLAGNLSVSDRWSILAEARYMHTMNFANEKMQDDFVTNVKFNNINGKGIYTYDSMEHYYNFGSYANIDVPVMVTYNYNRWVYMLGANLRYNFKINNIQEVEQRYLLEQSLTSTTDPKVPTEKTILLSDFSSRMNIGPVVGIGYQFRPALRMDLRISKPVWSNASTFGEKEISKQLYNLPQVQLNATWRFRSTKPYKRAQ